VLINWQDDTTDWVQLEETHFNQSHNYQKLPVGPPSITVVDNRGRLITKSPSFDKKQLSNAPELLKKRCTLTYVFQGPQQVSFTFTPVPPGEFSRPKNASVKVEISQPFYLSPRVTREQWNAVMRNASNNAQQAVSGMSWTEIQAFMQQLNAREHGSPFRLPTEAEWEYAAQFLRQANHKGEWTWVRDRYGVLPNHGVTDPTGPKAGSFRVIRRLESRRFGLPDTQSQELGFQILRQITESSDEETSFSKMFSSAGDAATRQIVQLARDINPDIEPQLAVGAARSRNQWRCE
jgi:hypothetical protein